MGTNFHWVEKPPCESCGRDYEALHIGKSSAGWTFSLNTHPVECIDSLDNWVGKWATPGSYIVDEYGNRLTPEQMLDVITNRQVQQEKPLKRSKVGYGSCIGRGEGSWDLFNGVFS